MILTVGNTKGGVGKTTLALNIAIARALQGRDVWLIDGDRQGTAQTAVSIRAVTDMNVAGKRLVVRADLNVPMADGRVTDATRITRFAEGMKPLLAQGAAAPRADMVACAGARVSDFAAAAPWLRRSATRPGACG